MVQQIRLMSRDPKKVIWCAMIRLRFYAVQSGLVAFAICSLSSGCNRTALPQGSQVNLASAEYAQKKWIGSECLVVVSSNIHVYYNGQVAGVDLQKVLYDLGRQKNGELKVSVLCDRSASVCNFLNVMQDISTASIDPCIKLVVLGGTRDYRYFPYHIPLLDGGRSTPWYRILVREPGKQNDDAKADIVYTNALMPGYARVSIHIHQQDYIISGVSRNSSDVQKILRKAVREYKIVAVDLVPQDNVTYQRVVDALDMCAEQDLESYALSTFAMDARPQPVPSPTNAPSPGAGSR